MHRWLRALVAVAVLAVSGQASAQTLPAGAASIRLINPSAAYAPGNDPTGLSDAPGVSDGHDGVDDLYRIVAWTSAVPEGSGVEFLLRRGDEEAPIGEAEEVSPARDAWESFWDIPSDLPAGPAILVARVLDGSGDELVRDEVEIRLSHRDAQVGGVVSDAADETVAVTWPLQGGKLGFHRPPGGAWSGVLDVSAGPGTQMLKAFYSVQTPGGEPEFFTCAERNTTAQAEPSKHELACTLAPEHSPWQVTAVGAVAEGTLDDQGLTEGPILTQGSADVVRVTGRQQRTKEMRVAMEPHGRGLAGTCVRFTVEVADRDGRPVQGANVDVHLEGPAGVALGSSATASGAKAPDAGEHETAPASNCAGGEVGEQAAHPAAAEDDDRVVSHRESTDGSGLSGPDGIGPGEWRFDVYLADPGFAEVTAWVDQPASLDGTDDDVRRRGEHAQTTWVQWLGGAPVVAVSPGSKSAAAGACVPYAAKVRSAGVVVPNINVDLEARGPVEGLSFCDPERGATLEQPETPPEEEPPSDEGPPPTVVRAEAVTDERGNLVFGVSAPGPGVAEISAWVDGEPWLDDDVPAADEAGATAVAAWFASPNDVGLGFIDPSPYGAIGSPGTGAGNQIPQDGEVSVTIRADAPDLAQGMELLVSSDGGQTFALLGAPERLGSGDLFLFDWKVDLPRGTHVLRAALPGTEVASDMNVTVGPPAQVVELSNRPLETVALSSPSQGGRATFVDGVTPVEGTAGPGAEGVDLFYTTHAGRTSPEAADWVFCGYVDLDGTTGAPQGFAGDCTLQPADRASFVTGVAAIAVDCTLMDGCDPAPGSAGIQGRGATKASGDAIGVWGSDDATTVGFIGRRKVPAGTCRAAPVAVTDGTGEPVTNEAVSVRVEGAGIRWCGGNHASKGGGARTFVPSADGVAIPRLVASMSGATRVIAWIDRDGDGTIDEGEPSAERILNWYAPQGCTILGTPGDDFLYGTPGSDRICGLGGADVIYGRAGDDHLFGGSGDDELHGGMGRDRLVGGPGSDHLFGGSDDELNGGPGEDHPENP